jgi:hypothetical protein
LWGFLAKPQLLGIPASHGSGVQIAVVVGASAKVVDADPIFIGHAR